MAENPDVVVEVETIPYPEYQQRLQLAVQGGNSPTVATVDQIWTAGLAARGNIISLDEYVAASGSVKRDNFFAGAWDSAVVDGQAFGVPFNVDVWQFTFYNEDLLLAADVDPQSLTTWDGLEAAGAALTGDGQFGIGLFGHLGEDTVVVMDSFIFSNEGEVLDSAGKCALNQPASVEALEYLAGLKQYAPAGVLNNSSGEMRELFLNGSLATEFWPALEQPTLQDSDINWGFLAGTAPAGKTPVGTYGGWNLSMFTDATDAERDAAWRFIEFITSPEVNGDVVDLLPANIEAAKAFVEANREGPEVILEHLNNAKPRPLSENYLELSTIQNEMFQSILNGTDAQSAADTACVAIDGL
jgi:ABC-type glycerol-3-phosphate transport system substrate-binding protein